MHSKKNFIGGTLWNLVKRTETPNRTFDICQVRTADSALHSLLFL